MSDDIIAIIEERRQRLIDEAVIAFEHDIWGKGGRNVFMIHGCHPTRRERFRNWLSWKWKTLKYRMTRWPWTNEPPCDFEDD